LGVYLEETAQRQYMASQLGDVYTLKTDEVEVIRKNLWRPQLLQKVWDYHYAKL